MRHASSLEGLEDATCDVGLLWIRIERVVLGEGDVFDWDLAGALAACCGRPCCAPTPSNVAEAVARAEAGESTWRPASRMRQHQERGERIAFVEAAWS